jgi:drug/metabolite transporter (DMT)-like permease
LSLATFGIVLFAALLHSAWNAIVKGAKDTTLTTILVTLGAALFAVVALPFLPQPAPASWPFLAVAAILQVVYFSLVAAAYGAADMSQAYPLMRGFAPLIVASVGTVAIGEHPSLTAWAGIALISIGVLSLALRGRLTNRRGIAFALANAVVIATYTLVDGTGARVSGSPAGYTLWLSLLTAIPFLIYVLVSRRQAFLAYARTNWWLGIAGGVATVTSYGLALWAMTEAPIALVAALRETSILFGTLIAFFILREKIDAPRLVATLIIAAGAIVLRLA